jgi:hypothetical protein
MRTTRIAVLMLGLAALATPAAAQVPGINLHLGARVGAFTPTAALVEDAAGEVKLKPGLGVGASIELDIPLSLFNVRASVDAALNAKVEEAGEETGEEVDVVNIVGDIVFRPLPRLVVVQPYLMAGAGVKRYSGAGEDGDISDFTGHVGAGVDFKLGPLGILLEASDYISSFKDEETGDGKLQNDIFLMAGFRIGML